MIKKILFILGLLPTPAIAQTSFSQYMLNLGSKEEPDPIVVRIKTVQNLFTIFVYTPEGEYMEYKVEEVFENERGQTFVCGKTFFSLQVRDRLYIKTPFKSQEIAAQPISIDGVDILPLGETEAFIYKPYRLVHNEKKYIF